MVAMVIQKGITEIKNTRVNVPKVMMNNQMKNPITCADVTSSIDEILVCEDKNIQFPLSPKSFITALINRVK